MLGMKSNRGPVKGVFAEKLREQITITQTERQAAQVQAKSKSSAESKK